MNETDVIRRVGLGLAAVGLPVLLSVTVGLPVPVMLLLIVFAVAAVVVAERLRRRPEPVLRPVPAPQPSEATRLIRGTLPSDTPGYSFRFSGTMTCELLPNSRGPWHAEPAVFAEKVLLDRAAGVTQSCPPTDPDGARRRVAELLGARHRDEHSRVQAWVTDLSIEVDQEDAARLREVVGLQKDELLWERRRGHERNLRAYLGEDVLATTGSAVVWWLTKHLDDLTPTVSAVGDLHRLSRIARGDLDDLPAEHFLLDGTDGWGGMKNGPSGSEPGGPVHSAWPAAVDLVDDLFPEDSDERRYFVHEFGQLLHRAGRPDQERKIRDAFGVPRADNARPDGEPAEPWAEPDYPDDHGYPHDQGSPDDHNRADDGSSAGPV